MSYLSIVKNSRNFTKAFFEDVQSQPVSDSYRGIYNVLLYYAWRGAFHAATRVLKSEGQVDLVLLCLSTYKAYLPILQLTRMGYTTDACVLMRTLIERIAIFGYLNANPTLIDKYKTGKSNFQKEAMVWAKANSLPNWMKIHSMLTNISHSKPVGAAGHIFDENIIGESFRYLLPASKNPTSLTGEILALTWYANTAVTPFAEKVLAEKEFSIYPNDTSIKKHVEKEDLISFDSFIRALAIRYNKSKGPSLG